MSEPTTCPFCNEPAWPSFIRFEAFAAACGTAFTLSGEVNQSAQCHRIQSLRLNAGLNELLRETA